MKKARPRIKTILHIVSKFQVDSACFHGAATNENT